MNFLPHARHSLVAIGLFVLLVFVRTMAGSRLIDASDAAIARFELLYLFSGLAICGGWLHIDSKLRGKSPFTVTVALAALLWPAGPPIYLIATRRWRGITKLVATLVILTGIAFLGSVVGISTLTKVEQTGCTERRDHVSVDTRTSFARRR